MEAKNIRESIHDSILSVLEAGDASHPKYPTVYYLDPIEARVYWETQTGPGIPRFVHNRIWVKLFQAPVNAIPDSIVKALLEIEDRLVRDCEDNFLGTEWDGNNLVGVWRDKPDYSDESFEISVFWDPEDWFDIWDLQEIREKWEQGMTPEQVITDLYLGDATTGMVARDQAVEWLEAKFQEWQEEAVA